MCVISYAVDAERPDVEGLAAVARSGSRTPRPSRCGRPRSTSRLASSDEARRARRRGARAPRARRSDARRRPGTTSTKWSGWPWRDRRSRRCRRRRCTPGACAKRAGARVEPQVGAVVAHEVAARRAAGGRPGPARAQHRQLPRATSHRARLRGTDLGQLGSEEDAPRRARNARGVARGEELVLRRGRRRRAGAASAHAASRTRPWRSPRPTTPAPRRARAPSGAAPTAAGSACSRGSACRCPRSLSGARYPRAASRNSSLVVSPALHVLDETRTGRLCSATPAPASAIARS